MKTLLAFVALAGLAVVVWIARAPEATMERLRTAADAGDAQALERVVDFTTLRDNLKADLRDYLDTSARTSEDNPFAGLGAAIGGLLGDRLIDAFVTPEAIASLARGRRPDRQGDDRTRDYTVDRTGLDTFAVEFESGDRERGLRLHFDRYGLRWKLVRVELPPAG